MISVSYTHLDVYKRQVVGLPGDKIQYQDKHLIINGKPLDVQDVYKRQW